MSISSNINRITMYLKLKKMECLYVFQNIEAEKYIIYVNFLQSVISFE